MFAAAAETENKDLTGLLAKIPDPGEGTFTGPEWSVVRELVDPVMKDAPQSIEALVKMFVPRKEGEQVMDFKPRYLLHAVAIDLGRASEAERRKRFVDALAKTLEAQDRPAEIRASIIREIQFAGGPEAVSALARLLNDETLADPAAEALVATGGSGAAAEIRKVFADVKGRPRLAIANALGELKDAESADALRKAAQADAEKDVRLTAVWALANIGDPGAIDIALKSTNAEGFDRVRATDACFLLAENLKKAGKTAESKRIYSHLSETRTDASEKYVKEAADRLLAVS